MTMLRWAAVAVILGAVLAVRAGPTRADEPWEIAVHAAEKVGCVDRITS